MSTVQPSKAVPQTQLLQIYQEIIAKMFEETHKDHFGSLMTKENAEERMTILETVSSIIKSEYYY